MPGRALSTPVLIAWASEGIAVVQICSGTDSTDFGLLDIAGDSDLAAPLGNPPFMPPPRWA